MSYWQNFTVTGGYSILHKGGDGRFPNEKIPVPDNVIRLIFAGKTFGYDVNGNKLTDWAVILETANHYWWFFHLQQSSIPTSLNQIHQRGYIALHVKNHHAWGTHTHIGVARKLGAFTNVSAAERNGWTVDPLSVQNVSAGDTSPDVKIPEEYTKGNIFQYENDNRIFWHIPNPDVYSAYIGDWDLIDTVPNPYEMNKQLTDDLSKVRAENKILAKREDELGEQNRKLARELQEWVKDKHKVEQMQVQLEQIEKRLSVTAEQLSNARDNAQTYYTLAQEQKKQIGSLQRQVQILETRTIDKLPVREILYLLLRKIRRKWGVGSE